MCHGKEEEGFSLDVKKRRNFTWSLTDQWVPCQIQTTVPNNCAIYSDNPLQLCASLKEQPASQLTCVSYCVRLQLSGKHI